MDGTIPCVRGSQPVWNGKRERNTRVQAFMLLPCFLISTLPLLMFNGVGTCVKAHVWRPEDNLWDSALCFYYVGQGIELRPPDSEASIFYPVSHFTSSSLFLSMDEMWLTASSSCYCGLHLELWVKIHAFSFKLLLQECFSMVTWKQLWHWHSTALYSLP